ncbi:MAG TPA: ATP synthase delta/epsilon chain alpha-helix domain-containing protein, partial [Acidimicrobiia bacterium]|nr:ATP synthase delta/epsilon chain alpha-helix domain-containing protein [Acidimicrobiia bacterium]
VHGGFVEVSHDRVTILSDVAELASDIDLARARSAAERAEASLRDNHDAESEAALRRAQVRIELAESR